MSANVEVIDGKRVIKMLWYDDEFGFLLTQNELLRHGWTKATISKQLGEPDCFGRNPRGGAFVLLYSRDRVRRGKMRVVK